MAYTAYSKEQHGSELYDNAYKRVKALWSQARREFGITVTYEFCFAVMNNLPTGAHSHVFDRKDRSPVAILRVSKEEMQQDFDTILPREMAHIVCKIMPSLGSPTRRDEGWQKVYKKLGGKG